MNNYWIALPVAIKQSVKSYTANPDEYVPGEDVSKVRRIASLLMDFKGTNHMFKSYQGKDLYSFYGSSEAVDEVVEDFPQAVLLGSWDIDGTPLSSLDSDIDSYLVTPTLSSQVKLAGWTDRSVS